MIVLVPPFHSLVRACVRACVYVCVCVWGGGVWVCVWGGGVGVRARICARVNNWTFWTFLFAQWDRNGRSFKISVSNGEQGRRFTLVYLILKAAAKPLIYETCVLQADRMQPNLSTFSRLINAYSLATPTAIAHGANVCDVGCCLWHSSSIFRPSLMGGSLWTFRFCDAGSLLECISVYQPVDASKFWAKHAKNLCVCVCVCVRACVCACTCARV